ncbi:MAG: dihydrofolate reductase [Eggerthia catenaformis]|uniref:dihydrofolate reductase n=1 Tax=Eggerthia catenaformis TaxID=31973 RepID=UPI003FA06722
MITIIVACDNENLIGQKGTSNGMPWNNKEDLKHYKETTIHHTIVMGRKTYEAIGRPLPKRHVIVCTRKSFNDDRIEVRNNLEDVIKEYREKNEDLYICGGANIYKQALPLSDCILLSRIPGIHQGETYFPDFKDYGYLLKEIKPFETFNLEIYQRG